MIQIKKQTVGGKEIDLVDLVPEVQPTRTVRADVLLKQLKLEETRTADRLTKIRQDIEVLVNAGIKEFELPQTK